MDGYKRKVLIVDDSEDYLYSLARAFSRENYEVETAEDGTQALQKLKDGFLPDLVVVDVMMPNMNGLDFCRTVRRMPGIDHIPIILFTAHGDTAYIKEGVRSGADRCLAKDASRPFEVVAHADALLRRWPTGRVQPPQATNVAAGDQEGTVEARNERSPNNAARSGMTDRMKGGEARSPNGEIRTDEFPEVSGLAPEDMMLFEKGKEHFLGGRPLAAYEIWQRLAPRYKSNVTLKFYISSARTSIRKHAYKRLGDRDQMVIPVHDPSRYHELTPEEGQLLSWLKPRMSVKDILKHAMFDQMRTLDILGRLCEKGMLRTVPPTPRPPRGSAAERKPGPRKRAS